MIILLTVIAIVIAGIPLAAVVLVTVACRREESARSMADRAPGPVERAARRLLAFHASGISRPVSRAGSRDRGRSADGHQEDTPGVPAGVPVIASPIAATSPVMAAGIPMPAGPVMAAGMPAHASAVVAGPPV
ncbi:MAG TPA: hypothetical protein VH480_14730 [Streptosporangiaceae bacterium]